MPIKLEPMLSPGGFKVLRCHFSDDITQAEALEYTTKASHGGQFSAHGQLITGDTTGLTHDVRRVLMAVQQSTPDNPLPFAFVLESATARLAASRVMRPSGNDNFEFFETEAQGLAFLDERMVEYVKRRKT